jgi:hypothetical protein
LESRRIHPLKILELKEYAAHGTRFNKLAYVELWSNYSVLCTGVSSFCDRLRREINGAQSGFLRFHAIKAELKVPIKVIKNNFTTR